MTDVLTCPSCTEPSTLRSVDRAGVLIDACPRCRGVWLDRGELDKLIELESSRDDDFMAEIRGDTRESDPPSSRRDDRDSSSKHSEHGSKHGAKYGSSGQKKKRGGILGEFFDLG